VKSTFLLDVNVLIAAAWPTHSAHTKVQNWLAIHAREGWATCPLTELAFVRILSNPAFSPEALTPQQALALLRANLAHPAHQFWSDELAAPQALDLFAPRLSGHLQFTDAYLLGLVIARQAKLVTLDSSIRTLLSDQAEQQDTLVVL